MPANGEISNGLKTSGGKESNRLVNSGGKLRVKRQIGLWGGVSLIVGSIIGSGIFVSPKGVTQKTPNIGVSLIIWGTCGLFSLLGALCYAELGTLIPKSGGDFAYIHEAFGPLPAFLYLWVSMVLINPSAQAAVALTFSRYVLEPIYPSGEDCGQPDSAVRMLAALCLGLLTYVNCRSVRGSMGVQSIFTAAKLLALIFIVLVGFATITRGDTRHLSSPFEGDFSIEDLSFAFYSGLFAYAGWNYLNFATEELEDASVNLPRALWIGIPVVTIVYVTANFAYFSVLSIDEIILSPAVAVTFADRTVGTVGAWLMPLLVACSTFGGVNGIMFVTSRLLCVGAQEGQLPSVLGMIHLDLRTPVPALLLSCAISCAMLLTNDIFLLINYLSFSQWLFVGVSICALLRLRYTRPERLPTAFRAPRPVPYIFLLCCLFLVALPLYSQPAQTSIGILVLLSGVPVYYARRLCGRQKDKSLCEKGSPTWTIQKLLYVMTPDKMD